MSLTKTGKIRKIRAKNSRTVAQRAYDIYRKDLELNRQRNTIPEFNKEESITDATKYGTKDWRTRRPGQFSPLQEAYREPLTQEDFEMYVAAKIDPTLKGSARQAAWKKLAHQAAAAQAGTLTRGQAMDVKAIAMGQMGLETTDENGMTKVVFLSKPINGAESWKIRDIQNDRSYLSQIYEQLQEMGYETTEAFKFIGQAVFGSD